MRPMVHRKRRLRLAPLAKGYGYCPCSGVADPGRVSMQNMHARKLPFPHVAINTHTRAFHLFTLKQ